MFQPNPRGSFGQGEAFKTSNRRDFGGGDLRDILAGVDAVEKVAPVDDKRLGIYGHSYGGFMTMWTVTHSTRFKGAVADTGVGISAADQARALLRGIVHERGQLRDVVGLGDGAKGRLLVAWVAHPPIDGRRRICRTG